MVTGASTENFLNDSSKLNSLEKKIVGVERKKIFSSASSSNDDELSIKGTSPKGISLYCSIMLHYPSDRYNKRTADEV